MNTIMVELRYSDHKEPEALSSRGLLNVLDDLNDILTFMSENLGMDMLSVSHSYCAYPRQDQYHTTCIFMRNGQDANSIAQFIGKNEKYHGFEDGGKVSIVVF